MKKRPSWAADDAAAAVEHWFASRGLSPLPFQRRAWDAFDRGACGLIHAPTGCGKTLAAFLGPVRSFLRQPEPGSGLRLLWITPLRALATDTTLTLQEVAEAFATGWKVARRTSDSSATERDRQRETLPDVLVTTPESLCVFLSRPNAAELFARLRCVVVDEWHELLSTKRGTQTELALARLRHLQPDLQTWGLSATIGNLDEALRALLGTAIHDPVLIKGEIDKLVRFESLIPPNLDRFPWGGHMGLAMLPDVVDAVDEAASSLVFCNTRNQAENWYRAILESRPDWAGVIALHHGSLDPAVRRFVEDRLRQGKMKCVVCTSSLDLGVDFSPVERVFQIGSPKGIARLIQRAGRSGHRPDAESTVFFVPTHALELAELEAARRAALKHEVEPRIPIEKPIDVLVQHLITVALGFGVDPDTLLDEVRTAYAYRTLTGAEWEWAIEFASTGGPALRRYDDFQRLERLAGVYRVTTNRLARRHRMAIGTITADAEVKVKFRGGKTLGTVEERFVSRLNAGDVFNFAGRTLEFLSLRQLVAEVRPADGRRATAIPQWAGGRFPLSNLLSSELRSVLTSTDPSPERLALDPIYALQARLSSVPADDELLVERLESEEGFHLFLYPFEGRAVHEGLASLFAFRLGRLLPLSFSMSVTDYGLELVSDQPIPFHAGLESGLFAQENLEDDLLRSLNEAELARRRFREIARVAGLVFQGFPGSSKPLRHLQTSAGLIFDTLERYDAENLLLRQARREVLDLQLEGPRLKGALERMVRSRMVVCDIDRPTPFCFPLLVERLRNALSSEQLETRIRRMQVRLGRFADS